MRKQRLGNRDARVHMLFLVRIKVEREDVSLLPALDPPHEPADLVLARRNPPRFAAQRGAVDLLEEHDVFHDLDILRMHRQFADIEALQKLDLLQRGDA